MKIQINEVWNYIGKDKPLAVIEVSGNPHEAVWDWVEKNRPDLLMASGIYDHGYHAIEVSQ